MLQQYLKYIIMGSAAVLTIIVIAFVIISKKNRNSAKHIQQLKEKRW